MKRVFIFLFAAAAVLEVYSRFSGNDELHHWVKPALMVLLALYYFVATTPVNRSRVVLGALFFSFLGDSFLLYDEINPLYFMLGLGAFLLAHILYAITYVQHRDPETESALNRVHRIRMAFPVILAGTGLIVILFPVLGSLRIPVVVYAVVLMVMVINALFRYRLTGSSSFFLVVIGAVLFMISDAILAVNKFLQPVPNAGVWIMITYIAAQFLIIQGLVTHAPQLRR